MELHISVSKLALCGPAGAGKSTVAQILEESYGFVPISTGKVVREVSVALYGNENRENLVRIGKTLLGLDPNLVLRVALSRATTRSSLLVLDSIRCEADLTYSTENGFRIVRVTAPPDIRLKRLEERGQSHCLDLENESPLERFFETVPVDFELTNASGLQALKHALMILVSS
jgi:dephospho-CoA kinase